MVNFTYDQIVTIASKINRRVKLHPSAIAYLQELFTEAEHIVSGTEAINLLETIVKLATNLVRDYEFPVVWPWDIKEVIYDDDEVNHSLMLLGNTDESLPVTITIAGQIFTIHVPMEFVAGLLLFSHVANVDFDVKVFNRNFTKADIVPEGQNPGRFWGLEKKGTEESTYEVIVDGRTYKFNTVNFMQGFATGAQWVQVDHHDYWEDLTDQGNKVTF